MTVFNGPENSEPALLLFLRGLAGGALLLDQLGLAGLFLGLHQRGEFGFLARLALGGFLGLLDGTKSRLFGFARLALGPQPRFFDAPRLVLGPLLRAKLLALATRFGDRLQLGLALLEFLVARSGLLLEPVEQRFLGFVLAIKTVLNAGALGAASTCSLLQLPGYLRRAYRR